MVNQLIQLTPVASPNLPARQSNEKLFLRFREIIVEVGYDSLQSRAEGWQFNGGIFEQSKSEEYTIIHIKHDLLD